MNIYKQKLINKKRNKTKTVLVINQQDPPVTITKRG